MNKSMSILIKKQYSNREQLYLKDPNSDLYVMLKSKIYPLHKEYVTESEYFRTLVANKQNFHNIDPSIQQSTFQAIIGYFYGKPLFIYRNWTIIQLVNLAAVFGIGSIIDFIVGDIKDNFDQYGFFLLLVISNKIKNTWLSAKCQQQIIQMGFEQLNFNRYDLMLVDKNMFTEIIKMHEILKLNKQIQGLRGNQIKKIIRQYCDSNSLDDREFLSLVSLMVSSPTLQKNQSSLDSNNQKQESPSSQKKEKSQSFIQVYSNKYSNQQPQNTYQLRVFNTDKTRKLSLQSGSENVSKECSLEDQLKQIDKKFVKLSAMCSEQNLKYLNLKNQMEKYSNSGRKSDHSQNTLSVKHIGSSTGSTKDEKKNNTRNRKMSEMTSDKFTFPKIPHLSKDLD